MHIIHKFKNPVLLEILFIILLCIFMSVPVYAKENSEPTFLFEMSIEGNDTKEVSCGDIITVDLKLNRTDMDHPYTMYAMQNEIRYDSEFLELVENGFIISDKITSTDIANTDNFREFYVNFLSMSGGEQWDSSTKLGTIRFKVIGKSGVSKITSQDYLVSLKDGSGTYLCEANNVTVIVSTDCTVKFESRGGTPISDKTVQYGEKLDPPDDPVRESYSFEGWYSDIDLTDKWDFEKDKI
ncbi:MAG: InlB B-repeat-containing protein [bacterium]|nr:InlB B-repeat-containing protein [bacterium]